MSYYGVDESHIELDTFYTVKIHLRDYLRKYICRLKIYVYVCDLFICIFIKFIVLIYICFNF